MIDGTVRRPEQRSRVLLLLVIVATVGCSALLSGATSPPRAAAAGQQTSDSAITVRGSGEFAGLEVTVSQTQNLINQIVTVSWSGGVPTRPESSRVSKHFLSIMQCWGDDPNGPTREQCQYGARTDPNAGGLAVGSRRLSVSPLDPAETEYPPDPLLGSSVPFRSVKGTVSDSAPNEFFDRNTTNEEPFTRTWGDGTGIHYFEVQTALEAPGLGCGATTSSGAPRGCWLVVVPRSDKDVNGVGVGEADASEIESSPLSTTPWTDRLVIPLSFQPVETPCDFTKERRVIGQELVAEAMRRWQPGLCRDGAVTIGYSQVSDILARQKAISRQAGLSLVSSPVAVDDLPAAPVVYAPMAVSGLALAFLIERTPAFDVTLDREGSRVEDIRLTPRLLAKLLTQSYKYATPAVGGFNPALSANPETLTSDREFLELNPEFERLSYITVTDPLVPVGRSDVAAALWDYVFSDAESRAFLDGAADPWGTVVNPTYTGLTAPIDEFPKGDPHCSITIDQGATPLCGLDWRPYAADFHEAGRYAARGDSLSRATWDPLATPPSWRRSGIPPSGARGQLAITDVSTAERYGLGVARLRNAAGEFVGPTDDGLRAALAAMTPSAVDAGVRVPNPQSGDPAMYPLTAVTYAVTTPAALDPQAGAEYAEFIRYATGPGQRPGIGAGTLPAGYLPLPAELVAQATAAAGTIERDAGKPVTSPTSAATSAGSIRALPGAGLDPIGSGQTSRPIAGAIRPDASANIPVGDEPVLPSSAADAEQASASSAPALRGQATPDDALGAGRFVLGIAAALGALAAVAGPLALRLGARRGG